MARKSEKILIHVEPALLDAVTTYMQSRRMTSMSQAGRVALIFFLKAKEILTDSDIAALSCEDI